MIAENINKTTGKPRVLVAPLDWGLGHATRCIPVIRSLLSLGATVIIAADGAPKILLQKEFPSLEFLTLKGYRIRYSKTRAGLFLKLLSQLPRILSVIRYEKEWLRSFIETKQIDAVISDNRFGLSNKNIPCIYITHQLFIETGKDFLNTLAQRIHYRYINQFNECWVPDAAGDINLAGKLSHPQRKPGVPMKYLDVLSRFDKRNVELTNPLLILLSGPEPQRSIFEEMIVKQVGHLKHSAVLVRGLPGEKDETRFPANLKVHTHLPAADLNKLIASSDLVITRAGYSTLMDLAAMEKKAVIVPTPGQTEQEWLSEYTMEKGLFIAMQQKNFSLELAITKAQSFSFKTMPVIELPLHRVLTDFMLRLQQ